LELCRSGDREEKKMKIFKIAALSVLVTGLLVAMALAAGDAAKGKTLFNDPKLGGATAGISCNTCHPNGKGVEKAGDRKDLAEFINRCIVQANKGKALDPKSAEMADMIAYIKSLKGK
jgi:cytochrome c peroxidase